MYPLPDQTYLRECFKYNPWTGELTWRERPRHHFPTAKGHFIFHRDFVGMPAGSPSTSRVNVKLDGCLYGAHRLIWKWVTGKDPTNEIDHRNNNPFDNRWCNLREATHSQNGKNRANNKHRTGKGTYFRNGRYEAYIRVDYALRYLGIFQTEQEARAAYIAASKQLHGTFGNPGH